MIPILHMKKTGLSQGRDNQKRKGSEKKKFSSVQFDQKKRERERETRRKGNGTLQPIRIQKAVAVAEAVAVEKISR